MCPAQAVEKNHFLAPQNRHTSGPMSKEARLKNRIYSRRLLFFVALCLSLAILAPVAVLAA